MPSDTAGGTPCLTASGRRMVRDIRRTTERRTLTNPTGLDRTRPVGCPRPPHDFGRAGQRIGRRGWGPVRHRRPSFGRRPRPCRRGLDVWRIRCPWMAREGECEQWRKSVSDSSARTSPLRRPPRLHLLAGALYGIDVRYDLLVPSEIDLEFSMPTYWALSGSTPGALAGEDTHRSHGVGLSGMSTRASSVPGTPA